MHPPDLTNHICLGSAVCCFERPNFGHGDFDVNRVLVIRILKLTSRVKCVQSGYTGPLKPPREGGLLQRLGCGSKSAPWMYMIDERFKLMENLLPRETDFGSV